MPFPPERWIRPATGRERAASGVMASEDESMAVTSPGAARSIKGPTTCKAYVSASSSRALEETYFGRCVPRSEPRSARGQDQVDALVDPRADRTRQLRALIGDNLAR